MLARLLPLAVSSEGALADGRGGHGPGVGSAASGISGGGATRAPSAMSFRSAATHDGVSAVGGAVDGLATLGRPGSRGGGDTPRSFMVPSSPPAGQPATMERGACRVWVDGLVQRWSSYTVKLSLARDLVALLHILGVAHRHAATEAAAAPVVVLEIPCLSAVHSVRVALLQAAAAAPPPPTGASGVHLPSPSPVPPSGLPPSSALPGLAALVAAQGAGTRGGIASTSSGRAAPGGVGLTPSLGTAAPSRPVSPPQPPLLPPVPTAFVHSTPAALMEAQAMVAGWLADVVASLPPAQRDGFISPPDRVDLLTGFAAAVEGFLAQPPATAAAGERTCDWLVGWVSALHAWGSALEGAPDAAIAQCFTAACNLLAWFHGAVLSHSADVADGAGASRSEGVVNGCAAAMASMASWCQDAFAPAVHPPGRASVTLSGPASPLELVCADLGYRDARAPPQPPVDPSCRRVRDVVLAARGEAVAALCAAVVAGADTGHLPPAVGEACRETQRLVVRLLTHATSCAPALTASLLYCVVPLARRPELLDDLAALVTRVAGEWPETVMAACALRCARDVVWDGNRLSLSDPDDAMVGRRRADSTSGGGVRSPGNCVIEDVPAALFHVLLALQGALARAPVLPFPPRPPALGGYGDSHSHVPSAVTFTVHPDTPRSVRSRAPHSPTAAGPAGGLAVAVFAPLPLVPAAGDMTAAWQCGDNAPASDGAGSPHVTTAEHRSSRWWIGACPPRCCGGAFKRLPGRWAPSPTQPSSTSSPPHTAPWRPARWRG